jgi:hypothetical protein
MIWLESLEVHHLWFTCTARTPVRFGRQAGAQLRGALWEALQTSISDTDLLEALITLETPTAARGANPARPFSIRPPLDGGPAADRHYAVGESFTFGLSLFGHMVDLFPYVMQSVYQMGQIGVGYGRGQFVLKRAYATHPLTGAEQVLLDKGRIIAAPSVPVTASDVADYVRQMPWDTVWLRFLTPTQLTGDERTLLSTPQFDRLIARVIERAQNIAQNYTTVATPRSAWRDLHLSLQKQAGGVQMTRCNTHWLDVRSGSRRANSTKKISGFIGEAQFSGGLEPFLPWLVWGQSLQVGKNTVKGDGWYALA